MQIGERIERESEYSGKTGGERQRKQRQEFPLSTVWHTKATNRYAIISKSAFIRSLVDVVSCCGYCCLVEMKCWLQTAATATINQARPTNVRQNRTSMFGCRTCPVRFVAKSDAIEIRLNRLLNQICYFIWSIWFVSGI